MTDRVKQNECDPFASDCLLSNLAEGRLEFQLNENCSTCQLGCAQLEEFAGLVDKRLLGAEQELERKYLSPQIPKSQLESRRIAFDESKPNSDTASSAPAFDDDNKIPLTFREFGEYRLIRELGRGSMGVVYEAEQKRLGRHVALKILPDRYIKDKVGAQRFQREASAAASLHHTNIVPVHDLGCHEGTWYYTMQLIGGQDLLTVRERLQASRLKQLEPTLCEDDPYGESTILLKPISAQHRHYYPAIAIQDSCDVSSEDEKNAANSSDHILASSPTALIFGTREHIEFVARMGQQIADALQHAHERGVVHRDVKPSNLILDEKGVVWLVDFGLAKRGDEELTQTSQAPGTLRYMSPERFHGEASPASDLYALGMTLYELLVLEPAFPAMNHFELLDQIKNFDPLPPRVKNPAIPRDLQTIILKAIHKSPAKRYPDAASLAEDLDRFLLGQPILARRVRTIERVYLWVSRNPLVASLLALLFGTLITIAVSATLAALKFKNMAEEQTRLSEVAESATDESIRNLYSAETNLVSQNIEAAFGIISIRDYLKRWQLKSDSVNPQGWEYHLLNSHASEEYHVQDTRSNSNDPGAIGAIDISNDGNHLLVTLEDEIVVMEFDTRKEVSRIRLNRLPAYCAVFSPDDQLIAAGFDEKGIVIWDWSNNKLIREIYYPDAVGAIAWHPSGKELAFQTNGFYTRDDSLHIVDVATGQIGHSIKEDVAHHLRSFNYSSDGKLLSSSFVDPKDRTTGVRIWDTETWKPIAKHNHNREYVYSIDWNVDNQTIASSDVEGQVWIWNAVTGKAQRVVDLSMGVPTVQWSPKGDLLAIGGWDNSLRIWDNTHQKMTHILIGHESRLRSVEWHPTKPLLLSADWNGEIRTWDLTQRSAITSVSTDFEAYDAFTLQISWSHDSNWLAASNEHDFAVWQWNAQEISPQPNLHRDTSNPLFIEHDDRLITTGEKGEMILWDFKQDRLIKQMVIPEQTRCIVLSPNGREVFIGSRQFNSSFGLLRVKLETDQKPEQVSVIDGYLIDAAFAPDGKRMIVCPQDRFFEIIEAETGKALHRIYVDNPSLVTSVSWDPKSERFAIGSNSKLVEIRDSENFEIQRVLTGHLLEVTDVDWNPVYDRLATASRDKSIRIWDTNNWRTTMVLQHDDEVGAIRWSPDGKRLASISKDGILKVWDASRSYRAQELDEPSR